MHFPTFWKLYISATPFIFPLKYFHSLLYVSAIDCNNGYTLNIVHMVSIKKNMSLVIRILGVPCIISIVNGQLEKEYCRSN